MNDRIQRIESMLAASPQDQFLRYSLAMELRKNGSSARCTELFQGLITDEPPHIPAFLMYGQYLAENGDSEEACKILRRGIESARSQEENHAASEMAELLETLELTSG